METEEHLLSLKVMRLTKPSLASPIPLTCDSKDLPGNLLNNALQQDPTAVPGVLKLYALGNFCYCPKALYICVYSETQHIVNNITVKVDLQTSSQRLPLSAEPPTAQLKPDETVNIVIHYEVKEIGAHILVCEVSYQTANGLPASFKKFFKIQVLKPLDVKTKFYNAVNDDVYLEAQVQNLTTGPIFLEKVALNASHLFNVTSLNLPSQTGKNDIFKANQLLHPQSICQLLYCLTPNEKLSSDLKLLSGATHVGKLDISWRSNLGECGRLQTCQLQRTSLSYGDIRLSIVEMSNFAALEELFTFKCKLINNCERTVELIMSLENVNGLSWCDISSRKLKPMPPHSSQIIDFKCIPLKPGLHWISGIKLMDTFLKRTYTYDDLGQVFVLVELQQ